MKAQTCSSCGWFDPRDGAVYEPGMGHCHGVTPLERRFPLVMKNDYCPNWKCQEWVQLYFEKAAEFCHAEVEAYVHQNMYTSMTGEVYDDSVVS